MDLSVLEAAKLVGRSKSHVFRAIKAGTLSAARDAAGNYRIDRAELSRVFPPVQLGVPNGLSRRTDDAAVAQLEARLADALDQVHDLRQRLTAEADERRRLTLLLADKTDSRSPPPVADSSGAGRTPSKTGAPIAVPAEPVKPRRRWWHWST